MSVAGATLDIGAGAMLTLAPSGTPPAVTTLDWDPGHSGPTTGTASGGDGNWNTNCANWHNPATHDDQAWSNSGLDTAIFSGTAGTVTLASGISADVVSFQTDGYTLDGGTLAISGGTGFAYKLWPNKVLPMLGAIYSVREISMNPLRVKLERVTDAGTAQAGRHPPRIDGGPARLQRQLLVHQQNVGVFGPDLRAGKSGHRWRPQRRRAGGAPHGVVHRNPERPAGDRGLRVGAHRPRRRR